MEEDGGLTKAIAGVDSLRRKSEMRFIVACGTTDGDSLTDDHFGESEHFYIFHLDDFDAELVKKVRNTSREEIEDVTHGDPHKAREVSEILAEEAVNVILARKMGPNIVRISKKFVPVIFRGKSIDNGLNVLADNLHLVEREWRKGKKREYLVLKRPDKD